MEGSTTREEPGWRGEANEKAVGQEGVHSGRRGPNKMGSTPIMQNLAALGESENVSARRGDGDANRP